MRLLEDAAVQSHAERSRLQTQLQASREELRAVGQELAGQKEALQNGLVLEEQVKAASAENARLLGLLEMLTSEKAAAVDEAKRLGIALRKLEESSQVTRPQQRRIAACFWTFICLCQRFGVAGL